MLAVMVVSFGVNLLLLAGTRRMTSGGALPGMIPGGLLGAVYAGLCLYPGLEWLGGNGWRLLSLAGMALASFGWDLRSAAVFLLLEMALRGAVQAAGRGDGGTLLLAAAGLYLLSRCARRRRMIPVTLESGGRVVQLTALVDTGNELRDPVTGQSVLVAGAEAAEALTGLTAGELADPLNTAVQHPGLRLIPYEAVGTGRGMLLAKRFPKAKIGGRRCSALVAFAPGSIGGREYQALAGGMEW